MNNANDPKDKKDVTDPLQRIAYPPSEDIYNQQEKLPFHEDGDQAEDFENPGSDLDVPGSELDDAEEKVGEEDEENNYYSLGGDNHENLEEHD